MSGKLDVEKTEIFKNYLDRLNEDARRLAEDLYESWQHLGVGKEKSLERICKLNDIIEGFFGDIKEETNCQVKHLQKDIKALEDEAVILGKYLSLNIDVADCGLNKPLYIRKILLEKELESYRQEVSARIKQIKHLKDWQDDICRSLGKKPYDIREEPLLSKEEVSKLKARLELLQKEKDKRFETFTFQKQDIKDLMAELNLAASNEFERNLLNGDPAQFVLNEENLARILKLHGTLSIKLQEMKNMVMELREHLHTLWERLEEDPVYRGNFLDANPGHGIETIKALRGEIARCEEKKRQNLKMFIAKLRTEISRMWDECLFGDKDKELFGDFYAESFTENLLDRHEEYFRSLQKFYNENIDIFKLYDERCTLWRKMQEMEASSAPSRLTNRGGALLKEEKYRKAIAFKLPKLEALLNDQLQKYKERTGKEFTANDEPLAQIMEKDWDNRKQERQLKLSARKQKDGLTPTGAQLGHLKVSPLGKRNQTAKITPVPAKKQAFTTMSASKAQITADNSNLMKRSAVTSVRRNISPRQAFRTDGLTKGTILPPRRRLRMSDKGIEHNQNSPKKDNKTAAVFKAPPTITVNGNILKRKRRLSGKAKSSRRKSMRSQNSKSSDLAPTSEESEESFLKEIKTENVKGQDSTIMTSYSEFQEHLHGNVGSRSSVAPERVLRVRKDHPNVPDELPIVDSPRKNTIMSPMKPARVNTPRKGKENTLLDSAITPKSRLHITNVFGVTPTSNIQRMTRSNTQIISKPNAMNIDTLATPRIKTEGQTDGSAKNCSFLPLRRQNTVTLFSPMQHEKKLLRSSSSHNLMYNRSADTRKMAVSPSAIKNPPKLKLAKPLPLII